jgi:lysophospholipase L1-like esterase
MKALLAAALAVAALSAPPVAGGLTYAALGDSVAAGYGLGANLAPCARAETRSYPSRVERGLERRHGSIRFVFLACSGAAATDASGGWVSLRRQVREALRAVGDTRALVTITIGINDLEWWNLARVAGLLRGPRATFDSWVEQTTEGVRRAIRAELRRLLARPRLSVVLTDYFDPINEGSPLYVFCADRDLCRSRVGEAVRRLNESIRASTAGLGQRVRVAAIGKAFEGHEAASPACGSAPPGAGDTWIQADCLHPNDRGAQAIARAALAQAARLGL